MSGSVLLDRLRPGRDANDTSWVILRGAQGWAQALGQGAVWNPARDGLELAPRARPDLAADWLPLAPVAGPDGTLYRSDPVRDLLLAKGVCDPEFVPVPGLGGPGFATGRFRMPAGVAVDRRGRVYVADAGNARVQVVDRGAGAVVAVLLDWLSLPVHVALGPCGTIYVADAGTGAIHVFDADFTPRAALPLATLDPLTGEAWTAPPAPRPLAIGVLADGTLVAFDPARAWLWHMTATGAALPAHPWPDPWPEGWSPAPRRFAPEAEVVLGPIDSGTHDLAWHRVLVEADLPPSTALEVQSFAANRADPGPMALWAPERPTPMPAAAADRPGAGYDRLVLADQGAWALWRPGRLTRAAPDVAELQGTGPNGTNQLTLPADAAARVVPGDLLRLTTRVGGSADVAVTAVGATACTLALSGPEAAFVAPVALRLIRRDGAALPFGPLDLGFLVDPGQAALPGTARDGRPEPAALPHALAAFLRPGDILSFGGPEPARAEVLELPPAPVTFQLADNVPGDFRDCTVTLVAPHGRLVVRETLPELGLRPQGQEVTVIQHALAERHTLAWVGGDTLWLAAPLDGAVTQAEWTNATFPEPEASDRGRYLWLRLRVVGRGLPAPDGVGPPVLADATPLIRSLRVTGPRPSLLHWLPQVFAYRDPMQEPPGGNFLDRFLALFEGQFTRMEEALDSVQRLMNPAAADREWLDFVASWLDLSFDPSWPVARRRQLVIEGADLQAGRGTPAALRRYLEIYTGASVGISEDFRRRPPPPMQLGARGALGVAPLGPGGDDPERFAHRFTVTVQLPGGIDRRTATTAVREIIDRMKPAQTLYTLDARRGRAQRIGIDMAIDAIVIPRPTRTDPCACDPEAAPGPRPQPGHVPGGFRLGGRLGHGPVSETSFEGE